MHVLIVSNLYPPQVLGGYELVCEGVADAMRERGHRLTVLTSRGPSVAGQAHVCRELSLHLQGGRVRARHPLRRLPAEVRDARALRRVPPWDVAVVFHMVGLAKSLLATLHAQGPVAFVLGDLWPAWDLVDDTWLGRLHPAGPPGTPQTGVRRLRYPSLLARSVAPLARRAGVPTEWPDLFREGHYWANSRWVLDQLIARKRLPLADGRVIPHGIPLELFPPRPARPPGRRLLYVGRINRQKGADVALRALELLRGCDLTLIGPRDGSFSVEPWPARASIRPPVDRRELASVYAEHDVLLFPGTWKEPFGLVPLEAMAVGVPVVATGTGGSTEYLEHEGNCLLVEPGDAAALAAAAGRLLQDPELRRNLIAGGRATAARYSLRRTAEEIERATVALAEGRPITAGEPYPPGGADPVADPSLPEDPSGAQARGRTGGRR
jgi:glycogen(starch) synthase